jgi:hypothetical protein
MVEIKNIDVNNLECKNVSMNRIYINVSMNKYGYILWYIFE